MGKERTSGVRVMDLGGKIQNFLERGKKEKLLGKSRE
jgi:hypothetical protein